MNRSQAAVIALLAGLVLLIFIGLAFIVMFPVDRILTLPATATLAPSPTVTPSPTFPNFMPTFDPSTLTPAAPTATNTKIPTATPAPTNTPVPTVAIDLPEPVVRPTVTPTQPPPPAPVFTPTLDPASLTPTIGSRQYSFFFEANESTIIEDECTDLAWRVEGPVSVTLDGEPVERSGKREVCPDRDTTYVFTTQLTGNPQIDRHTVKVSVEEPDTPTPTSTP